MIPSGCRLKGKGYKNLLAKLQGEETRPQENNQLERKNPVQKTETISEEEERTRFRRQKPFQKKANNSEESKK
ncbi:MAG: hypothetical protein ABR519_09430 [Bacteroidales bacterium]